MDWTDEGIVLAARRHGESSAVVQLLTREHGRHAGLARGGSASRGRGVYQPGNLLSAHWRARLAEHLGSYSCELSRGYSALLLDDPARLAGLSSACAMAEAALPERHPYPKLYAGLVVLLEALVSSPAWAEVYARWELGLLEELGFGLDLSACAATGATEELIYVSPKSGRAVSRRAGEPYRHKLLPLPGFLVNREGGREDGDILAALKLTGSFLDRHVFAPHDRRLPQARGRFIDRLSRSPPISSGIRGNDDA